MSGVQIVAHSENGKRNGIYTYRCSNCDYRFRNTKLPTDAQIWMYQEGKQTVAG